MLSAAALVMQAVEVRGSQRGAGHRFLGKLTTTMKSVVTTWGPECARIGSRISMTDLFCDDFYKPANACGFGRLFVGFHHVSSNLP